ncbi:MULTISPECIES: PTS lactose/cellobiose transporter subunit IIA [Aerococcus]|nr:PTS lactose/cellobiose transporter subunit IIA [Aerococcus urinae]MDK7302802.1 PTS lactose/cellobiose transporter subunit IIA [Aerococcus urinae]MDK7801415.1 PTS lactose/cellobiose transporter subunit IIA [Aerococcus urinae]MDK8655045.1 PTS lactose/cellobiose transporter subunit IIA [Aerococcus urinae]
MKQDQMETVMGIIVNAGNAKSETMEALKLIKEKEFVQARKKLNKANESLILAHKKQTELLTLEAQGTSVDVDLITIHSQDHLMNAITNYDLVKELIEIFEAL